MGLVGFAVASALGGIAQTAALLFAARGLQGAFAALMAPAALSIITVTFTEPKERAKAFGVFGALSGGGAAIGLLVGGVLTEYTSWRWCLGVNVPVALLVAAAAVAVLHESKAPGDTKYDIPGVLLATTGLFSLVYGFTEAARLKNPDDPTAPRCRAGGPLDDHVARRGAGPARRVLRLGAPRRATRCCRCASSPTATGAAPT